GHQHQLSVTQFLFDRGPRRAVVMPVHERGLQKTVAARAFFEGAFVDEDVMLTVHLALPRPARGPRHRTDQPAVPAQQPAANRRLPRARWRGDDYWKSVVHRCLGTG